MNICRAACQPYATYQRVWTTAPEPTPDERGLLTLHDQATRTDSGLPLA